MTQLSGFQPIAAPRTPLDARVAAWQSGVTGWGRHVFREPRPRRADDIVMTSDDYLALADHPDLVAAQTAALSRFGAGLMMSGVFVLDDDPQRLFEADMADFLAAPAVLLCQSGWDANAGLLGALLAPLDAGRPVYPDMLAHASLWAGTRGTGAELRPWAHNDVAHLRRLLDRYGPGVVCVDTLYGTTGDLAPLADVVEACDEYGCTLVADESHALGVRGPRGEGLAVELGLAGRIPFRTASLAKAFAGRAGLIACPREFAGRRPPPSLNAVYGSALLPHDVAGLHTALRIVRDDSVRRARLSAVATRLHEGLVAVGCDTSPGTGPILPLHAGPDDNLCRMQEDLDALGVLGTAFLPPTTPRNRSILRLTAHSELTDEQVERVIAACATVAPLIRPRSRR